ncbi:MAG: hypothetical protein JTT11_04635 [Candidatus Brockarchaeota archaeon]|nr:hypothetical protein [Candidatus Brockarchaeota archaeon]
MALPFPVHGNLAVVHFLAVWLVSSFLLWLSARVFVGKKASFVVSAVAALVGAATFSLSSGRLLFTLIALALWLFVLKSLFNVGWAKALLIAVAAWILGAIVGWLLGIQTIF